MTFYGPVWPLKIGYEDTYELYDKLERQISFYLRNLILTAPGENISDPRYGVGLRRYLFEQNLDSTRDNLSSRISEQISIYLPFVQLRNVSVDASPEDIDGNILKVRIDYSFDNRPTNETFELDLSQTQNIGFY
tara:strand:- start:77 stop:478 length:402 start_codon:yes stop_codon:yes gene_type:complete